MKSLFQLFCVILLTSFAFVSCSSDEDGDGGGLDVNTVVYNGETFKITSALQYVEPAYENAKARNVELTLYFDQAKEQYVVFEMFAPATENKLVAGTYSFTKEDDWSKVAPMTFTEVASINDKELDLKGGSIKIATSGNTYTIEVNCTTGDNKNIKAYYIGSPALDGYNMD